MSADFNFYWILGSKISSRVAKNDSKKEMKERKKEEKKQKILKHSVQSFSRVQLFVTPWDAARQASLSITWKLAWLKISV